ncbi:MAG: TIGR01777 family oxidoreductase [Saprospiraceae bacterium]|nr:TIGR01777 family oxidoreductase [Saprospiraceae bacterium]
MKKSILIAGGSGLVGSRIVSLLDKEVYDIHILTRSPKSGDDITYHSWDFEQMTMDENAVKVDYIINLNGAGIADERWTKNRKELLISSRVKSAQLIQNALEKTGHRPKAYLSASAVGFYGDRADESLEESSPAGKGFMSECCQLWEESANKLSHLVDRLVINRIGIVLSTKGGALPKVLMTKKMGVYNYFGSGKQYYSWIHIDDLCKIFIRQLNDETLKGIFNTVAPEPLTNKQFTVEIKEALNGNIVLPAPVFGLRLVLGEMANVVLNSNRVYPKNLTNIGYKFEFPALGEAVKDLISRKV